MAEDFLQRLEPDSLARPTTDFGLDFLITFENLKGGVVTIGVEVKSTERPIREWFPIDDRVYRRLAYSNIPCWLLVMDVKLNKIFSTFPVPPGLRASNHIVRLRLEDITDWKISTVMRILTEQSSSSPNIESLG